MRMYEFEQLKVGDVVSPVSGINKGVRARVTSISDFTGNAELTE